jgi:ceramide glucosyltransferase
MAWAGALLLGMPVLGWCALVGSVLGRIVQAWVVGRYVVREKRLWTAMILFPLRDLIGPLIWALSYASNRIQWRGEIYELVEGGRMRRAAGSRAASLATSQLASTPEQR